jgi:hypothetical protein
MRRLLFLVGALGFTSMHALHLQLCCDDFCCFLALHAPWSAGTPASRTQLLLVLLRDAVPPIPAVATGTAVSDSSTPS